MRRIVILGLAVLLGFTGAAEAQTCLGGPDLSSADHLNVGGSAYIHAYDYEYEGMATMGGSSLFGQAQGGVAKGDPGYPTTWVVSGRAGDQLSLNTDRTVMICPMVRVTYS